MNPLWVDDEGTLTGHGPHVVIDPGIGPGRYRTALEALRASGRPLAFASFTFDASEVGSIVIAPNTTSLDPKPPSSAPAPSAGVVDDGVEEWRKGFDRAMHAVGDGLVEKVVLARQVVLELPEGLGPAEIVARLRTANPGCYLFAVGGLIGASPELLVSLREGRVRTLTLAGTATDPEGLENVKISEEHRHAADSVKAVLSRHLSGVDLTEQVIVPHGAMSHAGTRIEGKAIPGTTVADILTDLHPTPAVAGTPTGAAVSLIAEIEPGSRGRYAGPVGWMNAAGDGVFAIALRCGQIEESRITLFAGGGLVGGSEETAELAETELKLAPMLAALGQSPS
jgi:menaquinone-specific isochorismate synthase